LGDNGSRGTDEPDVLACSWIINVDVSVLALLTVNKTTTIGGLDVLLALFATQCRGPGVCSLHATGCHLRLVDSMA